MQSIPASSKRRSWRHGYRNITTSLPFGNEPLSIQLDFDHVALLYCMSKSNWIDNKIVDPKQTADIFISTLHTLL